MKVILKGTQELSQFNALTYNRDVFRNPYKTFCPNPGCENVVSRSSLNQDKGTWDKCQTAICFKCGEISHCCKSCRIKTIIERDLKEEAKDVKCCPNCLARIYKIDGC